MSDESTREPLPPIDVPVNAGFGRRSYVCRIDENGNITLPEPLVRELGLEPGDEIDWQFDEENFTLYAAVKRNDWQAPEWL